MNINEAHFLFYILDIAFVIFIFANESLLIPFLVIPLDNEGDVKYGDKTTEGGELVKQANWEPRVLKGLNFHVVDDPNLIRKHQPGLQIFEICNRLVTSWLWSFQQETRED